MLHITNGSAPRLAEAGLEGEVLFWFDAVHEGPTPEGLTLQQLSERRAQFVDEAGWEDHASARARFAERDQALAEHGRHDEVVLWCEHDLYDQIQLIQILAWLAEYRARMTRLSLICIDRFAEVTPFHGLGQLTPSQLASLFREREEVSAAQLDLGRRAWQAYCAPEPGPLVALVEQDCAPLPFLQAALRRHLQQYPSVTGGLSRTQHNALQVVADGEQRIDRIFEATQQLESARFMGDSVFVSIHLAPLCTGDHPLLRHEDPRRLERLVGVRRNADAWRQQLALTAEGRGVLEGQVNQISLNGIDRWLGGVHLDRSSPWRWDEGARRICRVAA